MPSPSPADEQQQLFAPHRAPVSVLWGCSVGPFSAAKDCCADRGLLSQSTHRLGVWSGLTWLALCHLFPGLLNIGQVKHPCLADAAAFLETTGRLGRGRAVGFPAQQPEVPSDWDLGTNSTFSAVCWLLCFILSTTNPRFPVIVYQNTPLTQTQNAQALHTCTFLTRPQIIPQALQIPHGAPCLLVITEMYRVRNPSKPQWPKTSYSRVCGSAGFR